MTAAAAPLPRPDDSSHAYHLRIAAFVEERRDCVPCRHVLAVMGFFCVLILYAIKVNLSVAIVAMVPQTPQSARDASAGDAVPMAIINGSEVFQWDESTQGLVLSAYYYGYVCTQLLGGVVAARCGGKVVVGPAMALAGALACLSPLALRTGGLIPFIITRVLQGAASGVVFPALHSLFSLWFPPTERTLFAGLTFASIHLGTVVGMALSGWLVTLGGWPLPFYVIGALGLLFLPPWAILIYDRPEAHPRISHHESQFLRRTLIVAASNPRRKVPWCAILSSPVVWAVTSVHTGYAWVLFTFVSGLPTYMSNILHFDIQKSAWMSSLPYLLQWASSSASGVASQWVRKRRLLGHLTTYRIMNGTFLLGSAACMLAITQLGSSHDSTVAMLCLYGVLGGAFFGGSYLNHLDIAVNHAGVLSGINQTMTAATGVLAPLVIGQVTQGQQTVARWNIIFYVAMAVSIGAYSIFHIFGSVDEQPWNHTDESDHSTTKQRRDSKGGDCDKEVSSQGPQP
ncbi:sialin-like [Ischnura elegans]|uniref:sialin-like n=1 Tax=Ischnura elegans TaxID=197161 RepID=UPI001ED8A0A0|nr:sialin-like [Ischnura elegans]